jgi:hypothetical protein
MILPSSFLVCTVDRVVLGCLQILTKMMLCVQNLKLLELQYQVTRLKFKIPTQDYGAKPAKTAPRCRQ